MVESQYRFSYRLWLYSRWISCLSLTDNLAEKGVHGAPDHLPVLPAQCSRRYTLLCSQRSPSAALCSSPRYAPVPYTTIPFMPDHLPFLIVYILYCTFAGPPDRLGGKHPMRWLAILLHMLTALFFLLVASSRFKKTRTSFRYNTMPPLPPPSLVLLTYASCFSFW